MKLNNYFKSFNLLGCYRSNRMLIIMSFSDNLLPGLERFFSMKLKSMVQIRLLNCCSGKKINPNEEICLQ